MDTNTYTLLEVILILAAIFLTSWVRWICVAAFIIVSIFATYHSRRIEKLVDALTVNLYNLMQYELSKDITLLNNNNDTDR